MEMMTTSIPTSMITTVETIAMWRFYVQAEVKVTKASHMDELVNSDTRIILLYSTKVATIIIIGIVIR